MLYRIPSPNVEIGGLHVADRKENNPKATRLLPYFLQAKGGLVSNTVMLCEVVGDEIQSISLRVAADALQHLQASD